MKARVVKFPFTLVPTTAPTHTLYVRDIWDTDFEAALAQVNGEVVGAHDEESVLRDAYRWAVFRRYR